MKGNNVKKNIIILIVLPFLFCVSGCSKKHENVSAEKISKMELTQLVTLSNNLKEELLGLDGVNNVVRLHAQADRGLTYRIEIIERDVIRSLQELIKCQKECNKTKPISNEKQMELTAKQEVFMNKQKEMVEYNAHKEKAAKFQQDLKDIRDSFKAIGIPVR